MGSRRGRPRTAWTDNIKTWTGLPVEESVRMTEDRDEWRKYVHGVANRRIEDGLENRTAGGAGHGGVHRPPTPGQYFDIGPKDSTAAAAGAILITELWQVPGGT